MFDDSWEHEVTFPKHIDDAIAPQSGAAGGEGGGKGGSEDRILLIVDVWHPDAPSRITGVR